MYRFARLLLPFCLLLSAAACAQPKRHKPAAPPALRTDLPKINYSQRWTDSVYSSMSPDERIGQLFMAAAYSGGKNVNEQQILSLIQSRQIGGLIFMQGGPGRQAALTNKYQQLAKVPLLIAMDAEWGLGMRLDSVASLPRQMMVGATRDTGLAYQLGYTIALQCKRLGVHVNFAPDVDVNNNPDNPVINSRSFGENKNQVSQLGLAYMKGMQDYNVMACAKHFPGHGDVSVDSHKDLPVITKSRARLDTLELYPFRQLIAGGVQSVMVAHLSVPALETGLHVPTTLSKNTITNLLRNELGFKGLIFTDALNMQGVARYFPAGEADYKAFLAGNDVLLFSQDVPGAIRKIRAGLTSGAIREADLEARVKKILNAKYNAGLYKPKAIELRYIASDLNQLTAPLYRKIAAAAITRVRAHAPQLPGAHVAYVAVNGALSPGALSLLHSSLSNVDVISVTKNNFSTATLARLKNYDAVIIGIHGASLNPGNNYGLGAEIRAFLAQASVLPNAITALYGNAYAAKYVCNATSLYIGYEDNEYTQQAMINVLCGKAEARGTLPVTPPCLKIAFLQKPFFSGGAACGIQ